MPRNRNYKKNSQLNSANNGLATGNGDLTHRNESNTDGSGLNNHSNGQLANLTKNLDLNKLQEPTRISQNNNDLCSNDKIIYSAYSDSTSHRALEFCKKPNTSGQMGRPIEVFANFYAVKIDYSKSFYQYQVDVTKKITKKNNTDVEVFVNKDKRRELIGEFLSRIGPYVYDGSNILFTLNQINNELMVYNIGEITVKLTDTGSKINFNELREYMIDNQLMSEPACSLNLLNTLMKQEKANSHICFKNRLFNINGNGKELDNGLLFFTGEYNSIKPCENGYFLNLDFETGIFYPNTHLIDFLKKSLKLRTIDENINSKQLKEFEKLIKGVLVNVTHLDSDRKYMISKLSIFKDAVQGANVLDFDYFYENGESSKITVQDYFKRDHKINLRYPYLPCLVINQKPHNLYLPMEVCKISKGQRFMKPLSKQIQSDISKYTVLNPSDRFSRTAELRQHHNDTALLKNFGLLNIDNQMIRIKARILDSPDLFFDSNKRIKSRNGQWNIQNTHLFKTIKLENWVLVDMVDYDITSEKKQFFNNAPRVWSECGIDINPPKTIDAKKLNISSVEEVFEKIQKYYPNPELVILIIDNNNDKYEKIKNIGDKQYGFITQCLLIKTLESQIKKNTFEVYLNNVALKINSKIGGINSVVDINNSSMNGEAVMFMGADVTKFGDNSNKSSIAAVVGSRDLHYTLYNAVLSEQQNHNPNKQSQEIILEIQEATTRLINSFQRNNKKYPDRIVFYRDGVDTGEFNEVLNFEIPKIKEACKDLGINPKLTFILAIKRHNSRFYCRNQRNEIENIQCGTVIGEQIVSRKIFDYYLCSHKAIRGTAKPTKYTVLYDENEFERDDLYDLTFKLCHLFARSTKSVSIPAPVYYAHLAAKRGRIYEGFSDSLSEGNDDVDTSIAISRLIEVHPDNEERMFFT